MNNFKINIILANLPRKEIYMKNKIFKVLTLLWMCFIFYMSAQNGVASAAGSGRIDRILAAIPFFSNLNIELLDFIVRKTAHFAEYTALGFLSANSFSGDNIEAKAFCLSVAYAAKRRNTPVLCARPPVYDKRCFNRQHRCPCGNFDILFV